MNVEDLFESLSFGELSSLSLSGEGSGEIQEAQKKKIILHANAGLKRIYSRFVLREQSVILNLYKHITNYHLEPRFAECYEPEGDDDNEEIRYILDLPKEPFTRDFLRILNVRDDQGNLLPLNNEDHPLSLFTPQSHVLQVPRPENGIALTVVYQAFHPELTGDTDQHIQLPPSLEEALTAYVGWKVLGNMITQDAQAKSIEHKKTFEDICKEVVELDTIATSTTTSNTRFTRNGWI